MRPCRKQELERIAGLAATAPWDRRDMQEAGDRVRNQTTITGPKKLAARAVPRLWTANRPAMMTIA